MRIVFRCLIPALVLAAGCNRQDTETLTRLSKKVVARAEAVTGEVRTGAAASWQGPAEDAVPGGAEARVAARLRWDKQLADVPIEVVPLGNGVELRGKVRNLEQRRRAVMLADSTAGVEGVKDSLVESDR
jgi:osmotically-inducible protein OsmY